MKTIGYADYIKLNEKEGIFEYFQAFTWFFFGFFKKV